MTTSFVKRAAGWIAATLLVFVSGWMAGVGYAGQPAAKQWPGQFPREGATKVFENERVIVWEQVWPKNVFMHKHVRDIVTIALESGGIKVLGADGKESNVTQLNGGKNGFVGYFKAGLGPHAELAADPATPPRAIFIELKGTEPADCKAWSEVCR